VSAFSFWDNLSEEQVLNHFCVLYDNIIFGVRLTNRLLIKPKIVDTIAESETTQQCADRLIDYVTELTQYNDDIDNATVIVVHLP